MKAATFFLIGVSILTKFYAYTLEKLDGASQKAKVTFSISKVKSLPAQHAHVRPQFKSVSVLINIVSPMYYMLLYYMDA